MPNNSAKKRFPLPVAIGLGITAFAMIIGMIVFVVWAYTSFGAVLVYSYTWLAGDTPVFDRWTAWAWIAPVILVGIFIISVRIALRLEFLSWPWRVGLGLVPNIWLTMPILFNLASKICGAVGLTRFDAAFYAMRSDSVWMVPLCLLFSIGSLIIIVSRHPVRNDADEEDSFAADVDFKVPEHHVQ